MAANIFYLPQSLDWSSGIEWNIHTWNTLRGNMKSMLHGRLRAEPAQLIRISKVRNIENAIYKTKLEAYIPIFASASELCVPGRKPDEAKVFLSCTAATYSVRTTTKCITVTTYKGQRNISSWAS